MLNAVVFLGIALVTVALAVLVNRIRFFARHEILSGLVLVGLAIVATTAWQCYQAYEQTLAALKLSIEDTETDINNQLSFALRYDVEVIKEGLAESDEQIQRQIDRFTTAFSFDEINIVNSNGILVASNVGKTGTSFVASDDATSRAYRKLLEGGRTFVQEPFRPSLVVADEYVKHFSLRRDNGGFVQLGYYWSSMEKDFGKLFFPTFEERVVSETGFFLITDAAGRIVLPVRRHPQAEGKTLRELGDTADMLNPRKHPMLKPFLTRLFGSWHVCVFCEPVGGWRGFAVLPLAEKMVPALLTSLLVSVLTALYFLIVRLALVRLRRTQVKVDALRAEKEARLAGDLALARSIQRAELRTDGTSGEGYAIRATMDAAREVGGDFYDYYTLSDGRLALVIADVSGKGIPAAFFMMKARTTIKSCMFERPTLSEALSAANARLERNNPAELFVTAWVGVWDRRTGILEYASAGHNPPLVRRRDGSVAWLEAPRAAALGVFPSARYRSAQVALAAGDRLFLYTDGVTEAMNVAGELLGNGRLEEAVRTATGALVGRVTQVVGDFAAGAEQADDITMLEFELIEEEKV